MIETALGEKGTVRNFSEFDWVLGDLGEVSSGEAVEKGGCELGQRPCQRWALQ